MLQDKTVQAVFTDQPLLSFYASAYALPSAYVSPILAPNPFSFVYVAGSRLRQYVVRAAGATRVHVVLGAVAR